MAKITPDAKAFYHQRINFVVFGLMEATATGTWLFLQVLPSLTGILDLISVVVGIIGTIAYTFWLWLCGAYKGDQHKALKIGITIGAAVIEALPFIDDLPADIAEDASIFVLTRIEDRKTAEDKAEAVAKAARQQEANAIKQEEFLRRRLERQQQEAEAA